MRSRACLAALISLALASSACSGDTCEPGSRENCACGEAPGERICSADGTFGDCNCSMCEGVARCDTRADCPEVMGGDGACWTCIQGCCVAAEEGSDPFDECEAAGGGTACTRPTCDGSGSCEHQVPLEDGTSCGFVCSPSGVYPGLCFDGFCTGLNSPISELCSGCCDGTDGTCGACPPEGCTAECRPSDCSLSCP